MRHRGSAGSAGTGGRARSPAVHGHDAPPPGPGRLGPARRTGRRPRARPARASSTSRAARSRCTSEDGALVDHLQRRDLQLRRAARGARPARSPFPHALRHRGDPPRSTKSTATDCVRALQRPFRLRDLGPPQRHACCSSRDRIGVRPLFYTRRRTAFAVRLRGQGAASRTPAGRGASSTRSGLDQIFTFWFPLAPRTVVRGHRRSCRPATSLRGRRRAARASRAATGSSTSRARRSRPQPPEALLSDELRELLLDATRLRLRADVPVGAYLSGGLDSSIIAALVKTASPTRRCAPSRSPSTTPSSTRAPTSRRWSAPRHRAPRDRAARCDDIGGVFPRGRSGMPSSRSCAPRRRRCSCCRSWCATSGFKVVLTGEGADEVLGGLRHLQGGEGPPLLGAQPGLAAAAAAAAAALSVSAGLQAQPRRYLQAFFGVRPRPGLDDPLFSHLPRWD